MKNRKPIAGSRLALADAGHKQFLMDMGLDLEAIKQDGTRLDLSGVGVLQDIPVKVMYQDIEAQGLNPVYFNPDGSAVQGGWGLTVAILAKFGVSVAMVKDETGAPAFWVLATKQRFEQMARGFQ